MSLNGRVGQLEARLEAARGPAQCRACGLRHVQPLTIALVRGALRVAGGCLGDGRGRPTPLCLCDPCCGEPGDRWLARRSHGLLADEGAA